MDVLLTEIVTGRRCRLFAIGDERGYSLLDFLAALEREREDEWAKILALLEQTADHGPPRNVEKCRFFKRERVFEFKTTGGVRIMAFWGEDRLILCSHGFVKKQQKTPKRELDRVVDARSRYEAAAAAGTVGVR